MGPGARALSSAPDAEQERAARIVAALFTSRHSAAAVGRAYLRQRQDRPSARQVLEELHLDAKSSGQCITPLRERLRADFESGRVVSIEGWVLSDTEAKLCALAALS